MQVIKNHMQELDSINRCLFCFDGEAAVEKAIQTISIALENDDGLSEEIKPIDLMLLDL